MQKLPDASVLPSFRFHPNAYELGIFEAAEGVCSACNHARQLRYTASFYSLVEVDYICPWCIADGTAARVFDGEFSDSAGIDTYSNETGSAIPVGITEIYEVATRTPSYPSWQQEEWRSHCGQPCAFLGDIGAEELPKFMAEPDFAADVNGGLGWDAKLLLEQLSVGGDIAGYLFQCLTCGAHRLHVDGS